MMANQPFSGPHQGMAFGNSPHFQQPACSPVLLVSNLNAEASLSSYFSSDLLIYFSVTCYNWVDVTSHVISK